MSDTVKLIIEISTETANAIKDNAMFAKDIADDIKWDVTGAIVNGTPLDDVKAEITEHHDIHLGELKSRSNIGILMFGSDAYDRGIKHAIEILDNIGKAESEET